MLRERRDFHHEVRDVRLADWVRPREYPDSIGSISSVDSLLMEFGKYLLDHDRFRAVVIASLDGGIRDLVIRYRQQSGRALFCVSDPRDANQTGAINAFLDRAQGMTAHIERVAALPQVERDGVTGFQISVELCIAGCRGLPCSVLVLFTTSDGRPLLDQNGGFVNAWGEVAVGCDFVPSHDPVVVGVTELLIPYSEWHLAPGSHDLRWRVGVFGPHGCLTWSEDQILTVNQGA